MRIAVSRQRHAFTLVEILLVVVIILIVTSISVPVIRSMLVDSRSTAAGDMVRGRLAEARSRAMEDGRPWRVAMLSGTGVIQLAPEESADWEQVAQDSIEKIDLIRDQLPPDIVFALTSEGIASSSGAPSAGSSWETIAVYLPAGDAREDRTVYFGNAGFLPRRAIVRGLTGAVAIEDPDSRTLSK